MLKNKCAHGARLYGSKITPPARFTKSFLKSHPEISNDSLFAHVLVLIKRLPTDADRKAFRDQLNRLVKKIYFLAVFYPSCYTFVMNKKRTRIDWHAGFAGGLGICFSKYQDVLDIDREYELTKESPRIDFIVIKKDAGVTIENDIGSAFKTYNIIEYKNPRDALNIDVVWKCIGYAALYKGLGKTVNAVPERELTISIFRSNYPRKFFSECRKNNRKIEMTAPGIYRVDGFSAIDLQIIATRDLKDDSLLALKIMMEDAEKEDIRRFIESAEKIDAPGLLEDARAVIKVSSAVNEGIYEDVLKESSVMSTIEKLEAAREKALADSRAEGKAEGIAEGRAEGKAEGRAEGRAEGKNEGKEEKEVENIRSLMETLSLSAKEAMKALKVPAAKQKKYVAML